jgi:hypothetical protein
VGNPTFSGKAKIGLLIIHLASRISRYPGLAAWLDGGVTVIPDDRATGDESSNVIPMAVLIGIALVGVVCLSVGCLRGGFGWSEVLSAAGCLSLGIGFVAIGLLELEWLQQIIGLFCWLLRLLHPMDLGQRGDPVGRDRPWPRSDRVGGDWVPDVRLGMFDGPAHCLRLKS